MGELLRREFDAQLADRNTKGYDLLVSESGLNFTPVQVKTVRTQPWFINRPSFVGELLDQITVYVLLGPANGQRPVRFFMARNRELIEHAHYPPDWLKNGFMKLKAIEQFENRWDIFSSGRGEAPTGLQTGCGLLPQ